MTLGACEYFSRIFIPANNRHFDTYNRDSLRKPQPYTMFGGAPMASVDGVILNSKGYKGKEAGPEKGKGEVRVVLIGGSEVFNGTETLADLLENAFRSDGLDKVRCYNYGVVSSVSTQELVRIVLEVVDLKPDLVVMYNGVNDVFSPLTLDPRPGFPFNFVVYEKNPLLYMDIGSYPAIPLFLYSSNVLRLIMPKYFIESFWGLSGLQKEADGGSERWRAQIAQNYIKSVHKAKVIANAFGAKFMAFYQPTLFFKEQVNYDERKIMGLFDLDGIRPFVQEMRARVLEQARVVLADDPGVFVDLSDVFLSSKENVFTDFMHTNAASKSKLAKIIYAKLVAAYGRGVFSRGD